MSARAGPSNAVGGDVIEIERGEAALARVRGGARGGRGGAGGKSEGRPTPRGKPLVYLSGRAKARAERIGLAGLDVSMSPSREYAGGVVVGQEGGLGTG